MTREQFLKRLARARAEYDSAYIFDVEELDVETVRDIAIALNEQLRNAEEKRIIYWDSLKYLQYDLETRWNIEIDDVEEDE